MQNTAKSLFNEINLKYMIKGSNKDKGTITELTRQRDETVEFSINWYSCFIVTFRPKTIGVKSTVTDIMTGDKKVTSKSYELSQPNLLETILNLIVTKV